MCKNKQLKLKDATKNELLEYFFAPKCEGRYGFPMDKERFLIWLESKRQQEILDAQEAVLNEAQKALKEYTDICKRIEGTKDMDAQLELLAMAKRAYEGYEQAYTKYTKLEKEVKS